MNAYQEMQDRQQKEFNSFPCFFAFGQEQFDEGMKKLGLKPSRHEADLPGPPAGCTTGRRTPTA